MANKKTSDYNVLPSGIVNDAWLLDIANPTVINYKGTALEFKDYVNSGKIGGKTIEGGTLTSQTLILHNNATDQLGMTINGAGDVEFDKNIILDVNKIISGDGTDTNYTVLEYSNAATNNPYIEWSKEVAGITGVPTYGLHLYVQDATKGAGWHLESETQEAASVVSTRADNINVYSFLGRLSTGSLEGGTRRGFRHYYNGTGKYLTIQSVTDSSIADIIQINPGATGHVSMLGTGATTLQSGTTAERPASPVNGMHRYNTDLNKHDFYENSAWINYVTTVTGLDNLTTAEVTQLANIDTTTISTTQWGYLGLMDQGVATTNSVVFAGANIKFDANSFLNITPLATRIELDVGGNTTDVWFNNATNDVNLSIYGTSSTPVIFVDAENNNIGLNTSSPDVSFLLDANGSVRVIGDLSATGSRVQKGWFTNLEVTNYPSVNGTALSDQYLATTNDVQFNSLQLSAGTSVNEIVTALSGSSTDDQLVTAQGAYESSVPGMKVTAPVDETSTGTTGQWAYSSGYMYRCIATDTWVRWAVVTSW
jgi:hypothetical protein